MKGKYTRSIETAPTPETKAEKEDGGVLHFPDLFRGDGKAEVSASMGYGFNYGKASAPSQSPSAVTNMNPLSTWPGTWRYTRRMN